MTEREAQEIKRLIEEHRKATKHLLTVLDHIPPVNCEPCWIERLFLLEPTIMLEKHKLD